MSERAPYVATLSENTPGVGTAASDDTIMLGEAPFAGTVTAVSYTPDADITGAATNYRRLALINRGASGAGSTVVAELSFVGGVNATAGDELTIPLSGTAANLVVAAGDVLAWFSDAVGTGLADPGGLVQVAVTRG